VNRRAQEHAQPEVAVWRLGVVALAFVVLVAALAWRTVELQVLDRQFLQTQGEARQMRTRSMPAHRGVITDRHGEPLAISSPVDSVWADPGQLREHPEAIGQLADILGLSPVALRQRLEARPGSEFAWIRRHVTPDLAEGVRQAGLPGVALQQEYRRFYPSGEVSAHLLGFTNIDDQGQEGLELTYDAWLRGEPGRKRVIQDRLGRVVEDVELLREPRAGRDLALSVDRRLQYLAYRELKRAVREHEAVSGSLVLLDIQSGEVLAMVNQPGFNPHRRHEIGNGIQRNRAIIDTYEPGSLIKPFTAMAAMQAGVAQPDTSLATSPGTLRVGRHTIRDIRDYGEIDVTTMLQKSSNVGAVRLALDMDEEALWGLLLQMGFGSSTFVGFQGEATGSVSSIPPRDEVQQATLSFGYGLSATPLQIARAYATLAADGVQRPVTLLNRNGQAPDEEEQVLEPRFARQVLEMLETVTLPGGTGTRAAVPGYRIAGKTGTVRKAGATGYGEDDGYIAMFAGVAPVSAPRLAMVVLVDEPSRGGYYGGQVAAPVFGQVMAGALRLLNIAPDGEATPEGMIVAGGEARP